MNGGTSSNHHVWVSEERLRAQQVPTSSIYACGS